MTHRRVGRVERGLQGRGIEPITKSDKNLRRRMGEGKRRKRREIERLKVCRREEGKLQKEVFVFYSVDEKVFK